MRANVAKLSRVSIVLMATIWIVSCSTPPTVIDDSCISFAPVYMSRDAVRALDPWPDVKRKIAANNQTWESRCVR